MALTGGLAEFYPSLWVRHFLGMGSRTFLVPFIGDIWFLIVGTFALIEGKRKV